MMACSAGTGPAAGYSRPPRVVRNANAAASAFGLDFPAFEGKASTLLGGAENADRAFRQTGPYPKSVKPFGLSAPRRSIS